MVSAGMIGGLLVLVILILVLTAMGPTIISNTDTASSKPLENASSSSKSMYSLIEILYPVIGLLAIVAFGLGRKA